MSLKSASKLYAHEFCVNKSHKLEKDHYSLQPSPQWLQSCFNFYSDEECGAILSFCKAFKLKCMCYKEYEYRKDFCQLCEGILDSRIPHINSKIPIKTIVERLSNLVL